MILIKKLCLLYYLPNSSRVLKITQSQIISSSGSTSTQKQITLSDLF